MSAPRRPLFVDGSFVTVAVTRDVERAIRKWASRHIDDLRSTLEPFGLTPNDLRQPDWERFIWADEAEPESEGSES